MSVYIKGKIYHFEFWCGGERFRGSTYKGNEKEARKVERDEKAKEKANLATRRRTGTGPITWFTAAARYNTEHVQVNLRHKAGTEHALALITKFFDEHSSRHILLQDVTFDVAVQLREWRSKQEAAGRGGRPVSKATVNRTGVEVLRKVMNYAKELGHQFPREPNWRKLKLKEEGKDIRELSPVEEGKLFDTARPDYADWLKFALLTGRRLGETLPKWSDVHEDAGVIVTKGKGGRPVVTTIFPAIAEILERAKGRNAEWVFCYECKRPKRGQRKGQWLPATYSGVKSEWQAHRKRHGVKGFRIHDLRADHGSKVNRLGGLTVASKALNHASTAVTAKHYAHTANAEVAAVQQRVAEARSWVPSKVPSTDN